MIELDDLSGYRTELTGFCYRMLGSTFDAEDAVQETLVRVWRRRDQFDPSKGSRRTWLYAIARNVCTDALRGRTRRTLPTLAGESSAPGSGLGMATPHRWITPAPDAWALDAESDPALIVQRRESIRLAYVAALQVLPPRQRAALILKDVLAWESSEIATVLGTSVPAVNSALQRARSTLAQRDLTPSDVLDPNDARQIALIERFMRAFEGNDVDGLVALMREDAAMTMPPFAWWLRGRETIRFAMEATQACRGSRLIPTTASGSPAFAQYQRPSADAPWQSRSLMVLDLHNGFIQEMTIFLDPTPLLTTLRLPVTPSELTEQLGDESVVRST